MATPPLPSTLHYRHLFLVGCCMCVLIVCVLVDWRPPLPTILFNLQWPAPPPSSNDIVAKTIDPHLHNGRTTSSYYHPMSPPVFGWLLCVSSSTGGRPHRMAAVLRKYIYNYLNEYCCYAISAIFPPPCNTNNDDNDADIRYHSWLLHCAALPRMCPCSAIHLIILVLSPLYPPDR